MATLPIHSIGLIHLIPEIVRHGAQQLIVLEVAVVLGAERHERTDERLNHLNGYRPRSLATQVGTST